MIGFQIGMLFAVFMIGEWIQSMLHLPVPGSVIGLIILFILLSTGVMNERFIKQGALFMNRHLVLFFIPATVGILQYYEFFIGKGILLILVTVVSTICVMISSGWSSQFIRKKGSHKNA